jgi:hypothetical protein
MFQLSLLEALFTIFAIIVLAYVSMATAIGPWISPAIILLTKFILELRGKSENSENIEKTALLVQISGALGGIIAVAVGFTLPMLFFIENKAFSSAIASPLTFCLVLGSVTIAAGSLGTWLARVFGPKLLENESFKFPVSRLISQTAKAKDGKEKTLFKGLFSSWGVIIARDGLNIGSFLKIPALLPQAFLLPTNIGALFPITISPTMWAMGFTAGMTIALPLAFGMISKYLVLYPLNHHAQFFGFSLFPATKELSFTSAFCSGMLLYEFLVGIFKMARGSLKQNFAPQGSVAQRSTFFEIIKERYQLTLSMFFGVEKEDKNFMEKVEPWIAITLSTLLLFFMKFSNTSIVFLIISSAAASHSISYFGARTGLVPLGRFITLFCMIPMLLIFSLSSVQIVWLSVFSAVVMAAASNLIFQYKVGDLNQIDRKTIHKHQWIGLILTAIVIGACFWLLLSNLQIGSEELFCQRGRTRALLVQSLNFDPIILLLGSIFGWLVKQLKLSPTMVFGGILMQNSLTVGLLIGALIAKLTPNQENAQPFWSGIFSGESIWIMLTLLFKAIY